MQTIFALSSGHGTSALAVIRISGVLAGKALLAMTNENRLPPARRAQLKYLVNPKDSKDVLDHALTLWFPAPKSFTGEDSAELQVHGGHAVVKAVLSALGSIPGRVGTPNFLDPENSGNLTIFPTPKFGDFFPIPRREFCPFFTHISRNLGQKWRSFELIFFISHTVLDNFKHNTVDCHPHFRNSRKLR